MMQSGKGRITIANKNMPNMVGQVATLLAKENVNISDMINQHRGELAYNIIDTDENVDEIIIENLKKIDGIIMARAL